MKFRLPLSKNIPKGIDVASLRQAFEAAAEPADAGEKLMRYHAVQETADKALSRIHDKMCNVTIVPSTLGGVGLVFTAVALSVPVVAAAGLVVMAGGFVCSEGYAKEAKKAITGLRERSSNGIREIMGSVSMEDVARSARFDDLMATFPDLKERFVVAASREKMLTPESPKLQRKQPGFNI